MKFIDITNHKYGKLTVLSFDKGDNWFCVCDCGNKKSVNKANLRSGHSTSCGCKGKENSIGSSHKGLRSHRLYQIWKTMIYRCTKPNRKEYKNYGGRGIKVCDEWLDFKNFIDDMGETHIEGYQLDRENNNGNYCKENCRWVKPKENKRNTRRCKLNQEKADYIRLSSKTPLELAKQFGCSRDAIYDVLHGLSWT